MEISEDDWKVVEARLQQDIDNGRGDEIGFMSLEDTTQKTSNQTRRLKEGCSVECSASDVNTETDIGKPRPPFPTTNISEAKE